MSKIIVIDRHGAEHAIPAKEGWQVMELIRDAGLPIEAACGGCCACATCHVYIDPQWIDKIQEKEEEEIDMLDLAMEVRDTSRLSCQISFTSRLDGLRLTLAPE